MKSLRTILTVLAALLAAPAAAAAATVHIVAFGDSATEGVLVPRNQAYPAQLQAALRAKGHDVQVHTGVTGDTTAGALQIYDFFLQRRNESNARRFSVDNVKRHRSRMTPGERYRARAAELSAKAQGEAPPAIRLEYENLALAYLRLAEQADRNSLTDIVYEPAPKRPGVQQPEPQQEPKPAADE